jgi:hypothetical protein
VHWTPISRAIRSTTSRNRAASSLSSRGADAGSRTGASPAATVAITRAGS